MSGAETGKQCGDEAENNDSIEASTTHEVSQRQFVKEAEEELRNYEWSMFNLTREEAMKCLEYTGKLDDSYESACGRQFKMYNVTAHLILNQLDDLEKHVDNDVVKEPKCIHVWSNKVMLHLKQGEQKKAQDALNSLEKVKADPVQVAMAKVDYAYWMAERRRTVKVRKESCEIFESIADNQELKRVPEGLKVAELSSLAHLKILVRSLKDSRPKATSPPNRDELDMLQRALSLLPELKGSSIPNKDLQHWLWLSEIILLRVFRRLEGSSQGELIVPFCHLLDMGEQNQVTDLALQLLKMFESTDCSENHKLLARAGKNIINIVGKYELGLGDDECRKLMRVAIKKSRRAKKSTSCKKMANSTISIANEYLKSHAPKGADRDNNWRDSHARSLNPDPELVTTYAPTRTSGQSAADNSVWNNWREGKKE